MPTMLDDRIIERALRAVIAITVLAASAALWWPAGAHAATRIKEVASVQEIGRAHV